METEDITLQKKQRVLMGFVIAAAVLALVLPFFGFYAGLCGVCLALMAFVGSFIAMYLKAKVFGVVMMLLTFFIVGPISSLVAINAGSSHYFGVDYYTISDLFEKLDKYSIEAQNAQASGNHELAVTYGEQMADEIRLFVTNIIDYQINKAKADGDMELVKELEGDRQKFIDKFNAKLQEKLGPEFEIDSAPVERELTPFQENEE
ncbi:MAG: hypothetical protein Q4C05_00770 [Akkermansia sp.]|nr:hypothetical protein [Akkermansia sp.]